MAAGEEREQVFLSKEPEVDVSSLPEERGMNYRHGRLSLLLMHGDHTGADGLLALGGLERGCACARVYPGSTPTSMRGRNTRPLQIPEGRSPATVLCGKRRKQHGDVGAALEMAGGGTGSS